MVKKPQQSRKVRKNRPKKQPKQRPELWQQTKPFIVVFVVAMVVMRVILIAWFGFVMALDKFGGMDWLLLVVVSIVAGVVQSKKQFVTYARAITYGAILGFCGGLIIACFDALLYRNFWAVMNIWRKPLLFAVLAAAVTVLSTTFKQPGAGLKPRK